MAYSGPGGRTGVLVGYIYDHAFESRNFGYASAVAMVLFALVLIVFLALQKYFVQGIASSGLKG